MHPSFFDLLFGISWLGILGIKHKGPVMVANANLSRRLLRVEQIGTRVNGKGGFPFTVTHPIHARSNDLIASRRTSSSR
jgi:hypothetical protein